MRVYVSWIGKSDPWPEKAGNDPKFPDDHQRWPGMPKVCRRGQCFDDLANPGPTISALFHPNSEWSLDKVQRAFLLWDKDEDHQGTVEQTIDRICEGAAASGSARRSSSNTSRRSRTRPITRW